MLKERTALDQKNQNKEKIKHRAQVELISYPGKNLNKHQRTRNDQEKESHSIRSECGLQSIHTNEQSYSGAIAVMSIPYWCEYISMSNASFSLIWFTSTSLHTYHSIFVYRNPNEMIHFGSEIDECVCFHFSRNFTTFYAPSNWSQFTNKKLDKTPKLYPFFLWVSG